MPHVLSELISSYVSHEEWDEEEVLLSPTCFDHHSIHPQYSSTFTEDELKLNNPRVIALRRDHPEAFADHIPILRFPINGWRVHIENSEDSYATYYIAPPFPSIHIFEIHPAKEVLQYYLDVVWKRFTQTHAEIFAQTYGDEHEGVLEDIDFKKWIQASLSSQHPASGKRRRTQETSSSSS